MQKEEKDTEKDEYKDTDEDKGKCARRCEPCKLFTK